MSPDSRAPQVGSDVLDYIADEHREFALLEMADTSAVGYFMPLLHELFGGSEGKTRVVFTILRRLMMDDRVRWARAELDEMFHWLRDGQRSYLLHRLSNVGWLEYYRDQSVYMISDKGEALMRMLARVTLGSRLVENEGAALADIEFSLLLDLDDVPERLIFLRNRLFKHSIRAETALESNSAYRILEVYQQLKSAYRWAEQTRQTLDHLDLGEDDDNDRWEAIRGVHDQLSQLHALIARMQLELQDIQRRQIDIARYGLTHLDFDNYLIHAPVDELAAMMRPRLRKVPHPFFLMADAAFAEAREMLDRDVDRPGAGARGWETETHDVDEASAEDRQLPAETRRLGRRLEEAPSEWRQLDDLMGETEWEEAAYRFSLITLLADLEPGRREHPELTVDPLIDVPVEAEFDAEAELAVVEYEGEVRRLTPGRFRRVATEESAP